MVRGIEQRIKKYVEVIASFKEDGRVVPLEIIWDDGRRYKITRVHDVRQAASLKVGGNGLRYCIEIDGRKTYLFFEQPRWFVEQKIYTRTGK